MAIAEAVDSSPTATTFAVRRFFMLQLLVWTTYGIVHYAASLPAILPEERLVIGMAKAIRALTGLGVSSLLVPLLEWRRFTHRAALGLIAGIAAVGAGFAWMLLDRVALVTVASAARLTIPWERFPRGMDLDYHFVMLAWTSAYLGLMLFERSRTQREELLRQQVHLQATHLSLLAAQLNPHFLFNALNTIRSLAAEDATRTREVVSRLSSFLRRVLSFDASVPVRLEQELDLARDYLSVEQARFESGLQIDFNVDPSTAEILVPPLILQPILENAIKHGENDADGIRRVTVGASTSDHRLILRVANSGTLGGRTTDGVGLRLTKSRLAHMYGDAQTFDLSQRDGNVEARISIDAAAQRRTP